MNQIPETSPKRLRLHYLDGLRGIAALYVVLVHIEPEIAGKSSQFWLVFDKILRYGAFSVVIFIVLSGYVLMLPVSRSQDGHISGTLVDYIKRRSRRILPPYYAALFLSLLLAFIILGLEQFTSFKWDEIAGKGAFSPRFTFIDVISHLFLVHNLSSTTHMTINPPMWSVATEWQMYFIFPFVLLPIWRRFGLIRTVIAAFVIGLAPVYLFNGLLESASPWFLGIFALGMVASEIGFSQKPQLVSMRKHLPWGWLTITMTIVGFLTEWQKFALPIWIGQSFLGAAGGCLFIYCTKIIVEGKKQPFLLQLLEHPQIVTLGTISYSLYLTHGPVLVLLRYWLFHLNLSADVFAILSFTLGVFVSLLVAYPFHVLFERPFMSAFIKKS
ncbi:acyltransferase family protein [Calothrix sp. 336/3]|uniref:acyltransferase family protein n=1 Tax=Calothrix sp. 336/3 TaxID=1337936 RepID=UPI0004E3CD8A|nr:acyltransferase [Calothrix sp. 336/3]AKG20771.1 acyltransferase [Calothrix sp. 336/3]